ncbi:hypothetical protein A5761_08700 [Mycolicibacterium setense]|uniref:hypothetical protein n=1 Tax=Mycolicibacterium setense TaxID=431269 RepID=UPI0007E9E8B0|nr:hypothetical protein [Mycolicibacterium setense]OBB18552.1 hypothetical protein A5761_08700 [Mycolicibacterium setense]
MGFTVCVPNGIDDQFSDTSTYQYLDHGMLKVTVKNEAGEPTLYRTFSPSGWTELLADPDHPAGRPKGGGGGSSRRVTVLP